jgi:hypothetical protein
MDKLLQLTGNICPESNLLNRKVPLVLNTAGFWESTETALQLHLVAGTAVVLRERGRGNFLPQSGLPAFPAGNLRLVQSREKFSSLPGQAFPDEEALQSFILREVEKPADRINGLTQVAVSGLLNFLPLLQHPDPDFTRIGTWGEMSSRVSTRTAQDLYRYLHNFGFIIPGFDWMQWSETGIAYADAPDTLQEADLKTVYRLISANLSADRVVEGHFDLIIENGFLATVLSRLQDWYHQHTHGHQ